MIRGGALVNQSPLGRFFGVVTHARTWLNLLFHVFAFPLGLFYFVFLVTGLSVGLGTVIIWVGIPILLLVAGAWWLFGAFERLQARHLLCANVPDAPRSWERAEGIWGKFKAHFGNAATWKDLLYLLAKLAFGVVSFSLLVTLAAFVAWLFALPFAAGWHVAMFDWGNGQSWTPPLWLGILGVPAGIIFAFVSLHVLNGWGWVCARWAELMFRVAAPPALPAGAAPPAPLVSTSARPPAPSAPSAPPAPAAPPAPVAPPAAGAPSAPAPPAVPAPPASGAPDTPGPSPGAPPVAPPPARTDIGSD
jgi:hypothetical protein